jgi:hypothetical protein
MFMILTRPARARLRHGKADLKLGPIIFGPHQLYITQMQSRELARQI